MKKVFVLFAVATLSLGAISCDDKKKEEVQQEVETPSTEENQAEATPAENQANEQEAAPSTEENQPEAAPAENQTTEQEAAPAK